MDAEEGRCLGQTDMTPMGKESNALMYRIREQGKQCLEGKESNALMHITGMFQSKLTKPYNAGRALHQVSVLVW